MHKIIAEKGEIHLSYLGPEFGKQNISIEATSLNYRTILHIASRCTQAHTIRIENWTNIFVLLFLCSF